MRIAVPQGYSAADVERRVVEPPKTAALPDTHPGERGPFVLQIGNVDPVRAEPNRHLLMVVELSPATRAARTLTAR